MEENYFCEACNKQFDGRGWSGHLRSKKHLLNIARAEDKNKSTEAPAEAPEEEPTEEAPKEEEAPEEEMPEANIGSIKIITEGGDGTKEKGTADKVFEFLFSPQVAPVTMALLDNIGNFLNARSQKDAKQEEGQLIETVSGAMVHVKNKEF